MTDGLRIRPASPGDAEAVLALWERSRSAHARTPDTPEALELLARRDPDALLVAELDGELAGTLIAAWDGWRGNMYRLAVAPELRRRGIGRALVAAGEEHLRELGARRVTALVGADDEVAVAAWRDSGYALDEKVGRLVKNV